ncbi:hypothetical protein FRB95_012047 [Tulasnella sp. JGI-2019a]|nr:hypothetical protein FRB95_012047 [Tulasnella sp. JGI-2019a]
MSQTPTIANFIGILKVYYSLNNHNRSKENEEFSQHLQMQGGLSSAAISEAFSEEQIRCITPKVKTKAGLLANNA